MDHDRTPTGAHRRAVRRTRLLEYAIALALLVGLVAGAVILLRSL
ncbi:MAG: hypothetical protein JWM84_901 [Nocardioides sp.]|nr:hypothetical protein [Nocardioides sp.]